jgi:hypothetical protein
LLFENEEGGVERYDEESLVVLWGVMAAVDNVVTDDGV